MRVFPKRKHALAVVLVLWAVVYLPHLGREEFRGEEGRRVLPAVRMLRTGEWIVPYVGGRAYFNKPPGINWIVAGSFALTGVQDEFTARLPSALSLLALALLLAVGRAPWMSARGRLVAACALLTCVGAVAKGRQIEIEGVYMALAGLATVLWLDGWSAGRNRWWLWLPPALLLACGGLIKGPFLAAPFYATVLLVLHSERRLKRIFDLQHLAGVALILAIGVGWLLLARERAGAERMSAMSGQAWGRILPEEMLWGFWAWNIVKAPLYLLPWLLFLPLAWVPYFVRQIPAGRRPTFRAVRAGMVAGFVVLCLMPGMLSRYALPVLPLGAIVVGWVLGEHRRTVWSDGVWRALLAVPAAGVAGVAVCVVLLAGMGRPVAGVALEVSAATVAAAVLAVALCAGLIRRWRELRGGPLLSLATAGVVAVSILLYTGTVVAHVGAHDAPNRRAAAAVAEHVPPGETAHVYDPGYEAFLFYVDRPVEYVLEPDELGASTRYVLVSRKAAEAPAVGGRLERANLRFVDSFPVSDEPGDRFRLYASAENDE